MWYFVVVNMPIFLRHYLFLILRALLQFTMQSKRNAWCFEVNNMFMLTSNNV